MDNCPIKLFVVDVDGTMTDGSYNVSSNGTITKRFCTQDFHGMMDLQNAGVDILILTSSTDDCIRMRYNHLPVEAKSRMELVCGKIDKLSFLSGYIKRKNIPMSEVAYMGDDIGDLECMRVAGHTGCPNDAHETIKKESFYRAEKNGGYGAVREFFEEYIWQRIKPYTNTTILGLE